MEVDCVIIEIDCKRVVDDINDSKIDRFHLGSSSLNEGTFCLNKINYQVCLGDKQMTPIMQHFLLYQLRYSQLH